MKATVVRAYLELRADALLTGDYRPSDVAWLDMKTNGIDVIIGPIETFEDALYAYKAAHAGVVLLKDREWSARLISLTAVLPQLQRGLPVPDVYKQETPGGDGQLGVYDAVTYTGHANAIPPQAINLPNDEDLQLTKGSRRLQVKNAMRWVFDQTIVPVADSLIAADQRKHVLMMPFMLVPMLLRADDYTGRSGHMAHMRHGA